MRNITEKEVEAHIASVKAQKAKSQGGLSIRSQTVSSFSNEYFDPDETGTAW